MNDLEIVTAAGVVATNKGPRVVIMHQYAYLGKGKTIHSCAQLENFKNDICDKSKVFGGKQRLLTPDGVVVPFAFRNGLPYMDIRPPSDTELDELPHIILTSDVTWDPSIADYEFDSTEDFAQDFPQDTQDIATSDVHDDGGYRRRHIARTQFQHDIASDGPHNLVEHDPGPPNKNNKVNENENYTQDNKDINDSDIVPELVPQWLTHLGEFMHHANIVSHDSFGFPTSSVMNIRHGLPHNMELTAFSRRPSVLYDLNGVIPRFREYFGIDTNDPGGNSFANPPTFGSYK